MRAVIFTAVAATVVGATSSLAQAPPGGAAKPDNYAKRSDYAKC